MLKKKLIGFDRHTIYRVYIKEQNKVIKVKDLRIFKDTTVKAYLVLPNFNRKPIFDRVQLLDAKEDAFSLKLATSKNILKSKKKLGE